jgi:hypothetical protein
MTGERVKAVTRTHGTTKDEIRIRRIIPPNCRIFRDACIDDYALAVPLFGVLYFEGSGDARGVGMERWNAGGVASFSERKADSVLIVC